MLDYRIEIVQAELGHSAFAIAMLYIKGKEINYVSFTSSNPSKHEIESKLRMLALHLYYNQHYTEYKRELYAIAFPFGQWHNRIY